MKNSIIERINEFISQRNISIKALSEMLCMEQTTVNNYFLKKRKVSYEFVERFSMTFDSISPEWLLTGKGDMLKQQEPSREVNLHSRNTYQNDGDITIGATANEPLVTYATAAGGNSSDCEKKLSDALLKIEHLTELIESKDKLLAEKERLISVLMKKQPIEEKL